MPRQLLLSGAPAGRMATVAEARGMREIRMNTVGAGFDRGSDVNGLKLPCEAGTGTPFEAEAR